MQCCHLCFLAQCSAPLADVSFFHDTREFNEFRSPACWAIVLQRKLGAFKFIIKRFLFKATHMGSMFATLLDVAKDCFKWSCAPTFNSEQ